MASSPAEIPDSALTAGRSRDYAALISWGLVATGATAQLWHFFAGRSLWLDEAFVGLNIHYLSFSELAGQLDYSQVAPIGWLWTLKLLDGVTGNLEYDLRILALTSGLVSLVVFRILAGRLLSGYGLICATGLFALSNRIVAYAAEVKPYGLDVTITCLILLVGLILSQNRGGWFAWIALLVLGCIAPAFSFPAAYILFSVGTALFFQRGIERDYRAAAGIAVMGLAWLGVFAWILLAYSLPQAAASTVTDGPSRDFFAASYSARLPPRSIGDLAWYPGAIKALLAYLFGGLPFVTATLLATGALYSLRRWPLIAAMLLLPIPAALLGSPAYPFFERLCLFLLPLMVLLMGAGLQWMTGQSRSTALSLVLLVLAMASTVWFLGVDLHQKPPFARHEIRPVLEALNREYRPSDQLYVTAIAAPAYLLYRESVGLQRIDWTAGVTPGEWNCVVRELTPVLSPGRLWVLVVTQQDEPWASGDFDVLMRARGLSGKLELKAVAHDAWLYSIDARPILDQPIPGLPPAGKECQAAYKERTARTTSRALAGR